jgi:V/A-type H+-transporting ATPase subunit I
MSLVQMKKVSFVGPLPRRDESIAQLEQLGVIHVMELADQFTEPPAELVAEVARAARIVETLQKTWETQTGKTEQFHQGDLADLLAHYDHVTQKKNQWEQELATLEKELRTVQPWGDFDLRDVRKLEERDVHLRLYHATSKELAKADLSFLQKAFWHSVIPLPGAKDRGIVAFFRGMPPEEIPFEKVSFPPRSVHELEKSIAHHHVDLDKARENLIELSTFLPVFRKHLADVQSRLARARVVGGLLEDGPIFAVGGFAPASRADRIREAFAGTTTVVLVEEPGPDDDVPIEFDNHWLIKPFEALIKMFNLPNYREPDPTILVAPFMGVFFGFCMGDGAYGLLLFILATILAMKFKKNPGVLPFFRLLQILGISTLVVGLLLGTVFGVSLPAIKALAPFKSVFALRYFNDPEQFFYLSLKIGCFQVMVGFLIKFVLSIKRSQFQTMICTIGWMMLLVGGYHALSQMTLDRFAIGFGGPGVAMLFLFSNPSPSVGKRLGGGAWALYNVAGLFGDVMSYARIFGLGMSSGIIAMVINQMAMSMLGPRPGLGWIFAPILLVFGHTFNFAMAIIGSLVHSARLNFLEYYGKFFDGGGKAYAPFGEHRQ